MLTARYKCHSARLAADAVIINAPERRRNGEPIVYAVAFDLWR